MKTLLERLQELRQIAGDMSTDKRPASVLELYDKIDKLVQDYINGNYKINNGWDD